MDLKFIRTLEMRMKASGADQTAAALQKVQTAHDGVAKAAATTASATEHAAKSGESLTASLAKYQLQFDPLLRNQQKFEKVEREMLALAKHVPAERERANAVIQRAALHYDSLSQAALLSGRAMADSGKAVNSATNAMISHTAGNRLARHELINLSRQFQDVGVSLSSGQSPLTVLVQQGSQIADVFASSTGTLRGFFSQVTGWAGRFAMSTAGVVTGVAALGATVGLAASSWSSGQRDIERSLSGIGRASGVTRDQINQIGVASSSAFGLSVSEAREAATAFASTGKIYRDNVTLATATVKDFARATGVDVDDATKTFTKALLDPAQGALELNKALGFLDVSTLNYIRSQQSSGNLQGAMNTLLTAMAPKIKEMAAQTGLLAKTWDLVGNAVSTKWGLLGKLSAQGAETLTGADLGGFSQDERLGRARQTLSARQASPFQGRLAQPGLKAAADEVKQLEAAQKQLNATMEQNRFNLFALDADKATRAIFPQIEQIEKLSAALFALQKTRETQDAFGGPAAKSSPAEAALLLRRRMDQQSLEQQQRQNAEVTKTADAYRGVSVAVALILDRQKDQLGIASAITAQEQMAAQEIATINSQRLAGLSLEERTRVAAGERAIAQAQINAGAQQQLLAMRDQLMVAQATTGAEQIMAQGQATYNALIRQGVDGRLASATAAMQEEIAIAQINSGIEQQVRGLRQQTALIEAKARGEEDTVRAAQAYGNAIRAGASDTQASALAGATLTNSLAQSAARASQMADQAERTAAALRDAQSISQQLDADFAVGGKSQWQNGGGTGQTYNQQVTSGWMKADFERFGGQQNVSWWGRENATGMQLYTPTAAGVKSARAFDIGKLEEKPFGSVPGYQYLGGQNWQNSPVDQSGGIMLMFENAMKIGAGVNDENTGLMQRLVGLAEDDQKASLIQQMIASVQMQPNNTIARAELLKSLNDQLKALTEATGSLEGAMKLRLDPLFSQGHEYLDDARLGYFNAARGLSGIVTGSGGTDSTPVRIMATPGERISITPPGQWGNGSSTSNDNKKIVTNHITINNNGASRQDRLSERQRVQGFISAAVRAVG